MKRTLTILAGCIVLVLVVPQMEVIGQSTLPPAQSMSQVLRRAQADEWKFTIDIRDPNGLVLSDAEYANEAHQWVVDHIPNDHLVIFKSANGKLQRWVHTGRILMIERKVVK